MEPQKVLGELLGPFLQLLLWATCLGQKIFVSLLLVCPQLPRPVLYRSLESSPASGCPQTLVGRGMEEPRGY